MSTNTVRPSAVNPRDAEAPGPLQRSSRTGIGRIIAGSMAAGLVVAVALVAAPLIPGRADVLTSVVLLGFAVGWALLAVLSVQFTDRPQRWAAAPAASLTVAGLVSLLGADTVVGQAFRWAWPPVLLVVVVWSIFRARRQMPRRARRWLVYPLLAGLGLSAIGGGYETVREAIDAAAHPMPGQLIDVGGHRLHLNCTGSGTPTVILQTGHGEVSSAMAWVTAEVAQDSRVCVYDRAGKGWSDPVDGPQDAVQIATDLHTLLDGANIPGPYILAGHSFGGLYVLTYAAQYADQVAGMVLLDSTAPRTGPVPATNGSYDLLGRISAPVAAVANLGAAHLIGDFYDSLPPRARAEARANVSTARSVQSYIDEFRAGAASARQAATLVDFGSKPLIVVTAGRAHDGRSLAAQDKLATLSTNSRHDVVADATHASLYLDKTHAAAASQAIRDVVASVRTLRPLK
jgi:pimeloyl-ACP methyl ester carboxylesterase